MSESFTPSTKGHSQAALWIILAAVTVIMLGALYYYMQKTKPSTNTSVVVNTNRVTNSNTTNNTNTTPVDTSNWKTYSNTKYGYSLKMPQSWGRISELDGSLDTNINGQSTQETTTLSLGPSDVLSKELYIQVDENKTLDQFLKDDTSTTGNGAKTIILGSSDFTTATGITGKRVLLDSSSVWSDFAYVFPKGKHLIDLRFLKENEDALNIINTLQFIQ